MVDKPTSMSCLSRRRFVASLAAAVFAEPHIARANTESPKLEIIVEHGGWASPVRIRVVLASVAGEVWPHCAGQRINPIRVYHRSDHPQTDLLPDWRGRVCIGLNSAEGRWAQLAFQFGHEFCHALAQHSDTAKHGWHPVRHANLWFEESLCETSSLFVLRHLSATWQQQSSNQNWRDYAPAMAAYASDRLAKPEHQLPPDTTFPAWFLQNEPALRADSMLREKNVIIARQMLPIFDAEPAGWDTACYLNLGAHLQGKPLAQHFAEWQNNCPANLRPFVSRLTALFRIGA
jgi:hypothetical protein